MQVKAWVEAIDWTKVPDIPANNLGECLNNTQGAADAATNGWWTCGAHHRDSAYADYTWSRRGRLTAVPSRVCAIADIVACPEKNTWGLTFECVIYRPHLAGDAC